MSAPPSGVPGVPEWPRSGPLEHLCRTDAHSFIGGPLVRRILAGLIAFLAMTATFVVLPVYAAPAPPARPVTPTSDEVPLGSVAAPEGDAVVTTDGEPQSAPSAPPQADPPPTPAPEDPTAEDPAPQEPAHDPDSDDVASSGDEIPGV